jgi:hypothetical protein
MAYAWLGHLAITSILEDENIENLKNEGIIMT